MSLRTEMIRQLRLFDDEAFVALANRGLLRRAAKDVATMNLRIMEDTDAMLRIGVGDRCVDFDARGPSHARCDCPSTTVCQHVLTAALWLQAQVGSAGSTTDTATSATIGAPSDEQTSRDTLHSALLGFDAKQLTAHGGKAGYRWAWQFVQDMDAPALISGDRHLVIDVPALRMTFRYLGGALDNLITDGRTHKLEKYRVVAVLAYRQACGLDIESPMGSRRAPVEEALDFGRDHALAGRAEDAQQASRQRLRRSAIQLVTECVELGLSHLSPSIHERFSTLAVWAQGAQYPRLALLLRRVADHVDLLLERSGSADEHRLLDEASLALALATALDAADRQGHTPKSLVGRARDRYESSTTIELLGLGATPWRSASGYVGLTMLFWSPRDREFMSCTDARPEAQRFFDPVARYTAAGPWSGLASPSQATGHRLTLTDARISPSGRISALEATHALVHADGEAIPWPSQLPSYASWSVLGNERAQILQSLLAEPRPLRDWVALQPARFGDAVFDQARQVLLWPLYDTEQRQLDVEIPYSEYAAAAIDRLQSPLAPLPARDTLLIARVRSVSGRLIADPLSLVDASVQNHCTVEPLYFSDRYTSRPGSSSHLFARRTAAKRPSFQLSADTMPALLNDLTHTLQFHAERGTGSANSSALEFTATIARLRAAGFTGFLGAHADERNAHQLLRLNYVRLQYARLLGGELIEADLP